VILETATAAQLLLAVTLVVLAVFTIFDARAYARFKTIDDTRERQRIFGRWVVQAMLLFGGGALIGLALLGRLGEIVAFPVEFLPATALLGELDDVRGLITGTLFGLVGGLILVSALALLRPPKEGEEVRVVGDIGALLPRNRAELPYGALLSANAGITEELFFRLYLPLLIVLAGGGAVLAFVAAALVFGLMHLYQGAAGVIGTSVMGLVFVLIYLVTGSLLLPILLHVLIDLNGLVLQPALLMRRRRLSSSAASPS